MKKITPQKAKELNQNFIKTRSNVIDKAIGKKDAISSWFSLTDLKEYIAYVENEGKAKGITVNGLRVYFGSYSKNNKNPVKNNLSTVFFCPTKAKKGAMQKDGITEADGGSDIEDIDALNFGGQGDPPNGSYPQL